MTEFENNMYLEGLKIQAEEKKINFDYDEDMTTLKANGVSWNDFI